MSGRALLVGVALSLCASGVRAQLLSPGKLSHAHAELEGMRQCTECHELGRPGASPAKCLACHAPLRARLERRDGWHASVADRACTDCHKEHLGRAFDVLRLDTASFDHAATGWELEGAHAPAGCRSCHRPERVQAPDVRAWAAQHAALDRTLLGLPEACAACHAEADPHEEQFGSRRCDECHDARAWEETDRFDHGRTRYALTGAHTRVDCAACHRANAQGVVRWAGVAAGSCATCHSDPHAGAMGGRCESCHRTAGWGRVERSAVERRFDHDRTGFALVGAHDRAGCTSCHTARPRRTEWLALRIERGTENRTYPRPASGSCAACHADWHRGTFRGEPGGVACDGCHGQDAWLPAAWGIAEHDLTRFPLEGAHTATPCDACHRPDAGARRFTIEDRTCVACHGADDPHGDRFEGVACEACHVPASFHTTGFDHDAAPPGRACASCHAPDDPHVGQFADSGCESCHTTTRFADLRFDHARARFRLAGAHETVACAACHRPERRDDGRAVVRYRPLPTECADCHGSSP